MFARRAASIRTFPITLDNDDISALGCRCEPNLDMSDTESAQEPTIWQRWWLVLFVPLVVFGQSWLVQFGLRDDYSILREVQDEPAKVVAFCASQGRFIYGLLLDVSFSALGGVNHLAIGRALSALSVGLAGAVIARALMRRLRWTGADAMLFGSLLTLVPATQVISSWAICWPHAFAGALGATAFGIAEGGLARQGAQRRFRLLGALAVMWISILTYQSNSLMYLVPVAAGWLCVDARRGWRWLCTHLGFVGVALASSYVLTLILFRVLDVVPSNRVAIEWHWLAKLAWAAQHPLREGLGLYAVRDMLGRTEPWYTVAQCVTAAAIVTALATQGRPDDATRAGDRAWLSQTAQRAAGWVLILFAAYAVSFVAIERWAAYRTIWPLTGVLLAAAYVGARRWVDAVAEATRRPEFVPRLAAVMTISLVALSAAWNVRALLVVPQAREWRHMREIASHFNPETGGRVFVVLPRPAAWTNAPLRHLDEFGSISGDSDWAAKEMFLQAVQSQHPGESNLAARLTWQSGDKPPAGVQAASIFELRADGGSWLW
jgi:hypothetical protein